MPVNNISLTGPSDYAAEMRSLERNRALAQALQQQSMTPIQSGSVNGIPIRISPYQGMAKLLQSFTGGMAMRRADEEERQFTQRYSDTMADTVTRAQRAATGTPDSPPLTPNDDDGNANP